MSKYKKMRINSEASYLILCKLLGYLSDLERLNGIKGLERFTVLGILRVHNKNLYDRGLITQSNGLGFMLTEKGLCYFKKLEAKLNDKH